MRAALLCLSLLACKTDPPPAGVPPAPEPGPLQAGVATALIPAAVGMGTVGFGPFGAPSSPSPLTELYPGTTGAYLLPEIKVVALSRGDGFETIFVRVDAVGMFQQLRRAVVLELKDRLGRDLDDALIFGATHTHSGPGRIIDSGGFFDFIADTYFPEFYDRFVQVMADTIEAALADLAPAEIATSAGYSAEAHKDRRCADGGPDYENGTTPFIAVRRDGQVDAVVTAYAVHGTALGLDDLTMSQDVSGAMEQSLEDWFDHPVEVLVLNSWAADMAPDAGEVPYLDGASMADPLQSIAETGWQFATDLGPVVTGALDWQDEPIIEAETHRAGIDREILGYEDGAFPYPYGAVYCEGDSDCDASTTVEGLDQVCLPFNADYPAPDQTVFTAGRVGDLFLITFPGEPGTRLAEGIMADIQAADPEIEDILFVGYGQDYLGYSIEEEDWWQGGYEASGHLWGPRQGDYLADVAVTVMGLYRGTASGLDEPAPIAPFDDPVYTPYAAEEGLDVGVVVAQPQAEVGATDLVEVTVQGTAPWLGTPTARIRGADGSPLLRPGGQEWTSALQPFEWRLDVRPSYADSLDPQPRTFAWTLRFPVRHPVPEVFALGGGTYTVEVAFPDGTVVESEAFNVSPAAD